MKRNTTYVLKRERINVPFTGNIEFNSGTFFVLHDVERMGGKKKSVRTSWHK